MYISRFL
nr:unnamed protein product [Callosobruchus analis]